MQYMIRTEIRLGLLFYYLIKWGILEILFMKK